MIGKQLAHYEILAELGRGGMGTVYRALDTKLHRDVALKLLPKEFGRDPERLARFQREARSLASLQHPNVASIYGFEEADGQRFLVMELVEGIDLSELMQRGPVDARRTMEIADQIAQGLDSAHQKGIVHRDLKPANIRICETGEVKVLDFGLARAYADEPDPQDLEHSPTITAAMTQAGVILGTAAYMSPEQARGRPVDQRTDIWSFGVVIYEMLTGQRLFDGETVSDTLGAILHVEPDLDRIPDHPRHLRRLLQRCLERDPRRRLRDIGDARIELDDALTGRHVPEPEAAQGTGRSAWIGLGLVTLLALGLGWVALNKPADRTGGTTTLGFLPGKGIYRDAPGLGWGAFDVAPDGSGIVYSNNHDPVLFIRPFDSFEPGTIAIQGHARMPIYSPDGQWIAYRNKTTIFKVAASGGAPIEICKAALGPGIDWADDRVIFAQSNGGGLWSVPASGGTPEQISKLSPEREETSHRWPSMLPDGRHILLTIKTARIETLDDGLIGVLSLDTGEVTVVLSGGMQARYLPGGHLVYGRNQQLFSIDFDPETLETSGTPRLVLDGVNTIPANGAAMFRVDNRGDLVYLPADGLKPSIQLVQIARNGGITSALDFDGSQVGSTSILNDPDVSPDGSRVAVMASAANDIILVIDLGNGAIRKLARTPGNNIVPLWSPDGSMVCYSNDLRGSQDLWVIPVDGSTEARSLIQSDRAAVASSWYPDSSGILYTSVSRDGKVDIWYVEKESGETRPWLATPAAEGDGQFSPDGKHIAYTSDVDGKPEVYLRGWPEPGAARRISTEGGTVPRWSADGSELYFMNGELLKAVPIQRSGNEIRVGEAEILFSVGQYGVEDLRPAPDGKGFIGLKMDGIEPEYRHARVIFDWAQKVVDRN